LRFPCWCPLQVRGFYTGSSGFLEARSQERQNSLRSKGGDQDRKAGSLVLTEDQVEQERAEELRADVPLNLSEEPQGVFAGHLGMGFEELDELPYSGSSPWVEQPNSRGLSKLKPPPPRSKNIGDPVPGTPCSLVEEPVFLICGQKTTEVGMSTVYVPTKELKNHGQGAEPWLERNLLPLGSTQLESTIKAIVVTGDIQVAGNRDFAGRGCFEQPSQHVRLIEPHALS